MHCVDFHKHGLPHAHILIQYEHNCLSPSDIDTAVSAKLPSNEDNRNIIKHQMLHRHPPNDGNTLPEYCTKKGNIWHAVFATLTLSMQQPISMEKDT